MTLHSSWKCKQAARSGIIIVRRPETVTNVSLNTRARKIKEPYVTKEHNAVIAIKRDSPRASLHIHTYNILYEYAPGMFHVGSIISTRSAEGRSCKSEITILLI